MTSNQNFLKNHLILSTIILIVLAVVFGHGISTFKSGRNKNVTGSITSFQYNNFPMCTADVSYDVEASGHYQTNIGLPCFGVTVEKPLPIDLCYNAWHPDNVEYRDDNNFGSRWQLCSTSYSTARRQVIVVSVIFVVLIFTWIVHILFIACNKKVTPVAMPQPTSNIAMQQPA